MDNFNIPSYLTYQEDPECLQWYNIEGKERINELSHQLRTYLNYKRASILLICSDSNLSSNILKIDSVQKWEDRFLSILSQYISLIRENEVQNERIKEKIFHLKIKAISQPNCQDSILLKNIKQVGNELWKILHILSDLDIHTRPQVLKLSIEILVHLCDAESELNPLFSNFYQELKLNYQQLEREYDHMFVKNRTL